MDQRVLFRSVRGTHLVVSSSPPKISGAILKCFSAYSRWYVGRHFHAVRLSISGGVPTLSDAPSVVYLNHASWWDPLIGLLLARKFWPTRQHYAPIDAAELKRYRILSRIGFFGVEADTRRGAAMFLRSGSAILRSPNSAIWITSEGEFKDPRTRPVELRVGLAHLARKHAGVAMVPLAIEYPFWQERFPEALCRFGTPIFAAESGRDVDEWTAHLGEQMQINQDALAAESIGRKAESFQTILRGRAGVGGVYDAWRWAIAKVGGERFRKEHGDESR